MTRTRPHPLSPRERVMVRVLNKRYRLLEVVGGGGMSTVYRARDVQDLHAGKARRGEPRIVAIKEVRLEDLGPEDRAQVLAQFKKEGAILSTLNHPNLPRVMDYFSTRTAHYLVMEFVKGQSLERILEGLHGRPMDEKKAIVFGIQICRVLHYLGIQRPRPIVFRDIKPSNIMITPSGRVKLVDFGIARFLKDTKSQDTFVFGTPGYAAPEQYGSGQTDQRSDIFSLGATLHHCLTGRQPPASPFDFRAVRELNPGVSRKTSEVVMKALRVKRDERYQNAQDMKVDLYDALAQNGALIKGDDSFISRTTRVLTRSAPHRTLPLNTIPVGPLSFLRKRPSPRFFEMPLTALGCATLRGEIRFDKNWIRARPSTFTEGTPSTMLEVDPSGFEFGRVYTARASITTNSGVLRPLLTFQTLPSFLSWTLLFLSVSSLLLFLV